MESLQYLLKEDIWSGISSILGFQNNEISL